MPELFDGTSAWYARFAVQRLLEGDPKVRRLMGRDPFPNDRPDRIRAHLYHDRFTTPAERRETGRWWARTLLGTYLPPVALGSEGRLVQHADARR